MFHLKQKLCRNPIRLLAVMLAMALIVTLTPYPAVAVQAAEGDNLLETNGGAVTWDFRDQNAEIYKGTDGSLSVSGTFSWHDVTHGAVVQDGVTFSLNVPKGMTTIHLGMCREGSETLSAEATSTDGSLENEFSFKVETDGEEKTIQYTSENASTITISLSGDGQGYLHYITAETVTPPEVATVSGNVTAASESGNSVDGQTLSFVNESGETVATTEINGGQYSVSLPIGETYTVTFENSDVYAITDGGTIDLTSTVNGDSVTNDITYNVIWDTSKNFSFSIDDTTFNVSPGVSSSADFNVSAEGGNGFVELATANTAIIWANLGGAGEGTVREDDVKLISGNVQPSISGNTITFTYDDSETSPESYDIQVKDNSGLGSSPQADGETREYNFGNGSIVSELYTGDYSITDNNSVSSTDGLVTVTGVNHIRYNGSHGIMLGNGDQISVKVAGDAVIDLALCSYSAENSTWSISADTTGTLSENEIPAITATDGTDTRITYEGETATITFTYNGSGSGYIHSMSVTNELPETEVNEQEEMPSETGNTKALEVKAVGQRLTLKQTGGSLASGEEVSDNISYYGFEAADSFNKFEADVTVNSCESGSSHGIFVGVFNETNIATVGIRNSTNLRGIYTSDDNMIHAGEIDETIAEDQTVHFTIERSAATTRAASDQVIITATPEGGETYTMTRECEGNVSFGLILAGASVTVTNMKYYDADGKNLYDQNNCYSPVGTEPVITNVYAEPAETRDSIIVSWRYSTAAFGDGRYVIQVKRPGSTVWEDLAETTENSYICPATEEGTYEFRVGGKLGNDDTVDWTNAHTATVKDFLPALENIVLTAEASANSIDLSWTAVDEATYYEIYRYSSDEGAENAKLLYTENSGKLSYVDSEVTAEVPYYYYIIAKSAVNSSNPSATVWALPTAGHTGDYVYEDEAAVITIDYKSPDTVYAEKVFINGTIDRAGVLRTYVNDEMVSEQNIAANGAFDLNLTVASGRNNVELVFTDAKGKETRQAYSFVYLTNASMIVDASYTGEDGAPDANGVPTYKTVQAAVDAVPAGNTERTTIFIKNGDYEERLVVSAPNISLIGESRDGVTIHCYPADLYPDDEEYEAGGDMAKRCATYIQSSATGFSAENLTFKNDYVYGTDDGKSNKSADALRCDADEATFVNVTISGVQDTLYMHSGNQYYYQCRIEGLIDFIYSGDDARALFEDCDIVFVYEETHPEGGYVCAPRTAADAPYGLIFKDCAITSEEGCVDGTFCLARPWGPTAKICWINCYMGSAINADEPYADMSGNSFMNASFYEYGSYGPGYAVNEFRRQFSPTQAQHLLDSLGWDPSGLISSTGNAYVGDLVLGSAEEDPEDKPNTNPPGGGGSTGDDTTTPPTEKPGDTSDGETTDDPSGNGGSDSGTTDVNGNGSGQNGSSQNVTDDQNANGTGAGKEAGAVSTGDNSSLIVWISVLLISSIAAAVILAAKASKKRK